MTKQEMIDEYIKCRDDKVYFIEKYCKIISPHDGVIDTRLYEWQKDFINKKNIQVDTARQVGFSTLAYLNILHTIIFFDNKTIVKLSSHYGVDATIFYQLYDMCTYEWKPNLISKSKRDFKTENGNRVIFGKVYTSLIRGYTINELYLEDFNFIDQSNAHEFLYAILPTIVANKNSNMWVWGGISERNNIKINQLEQHALPFWATSDDNYVRYKNANMYIGKENTKRELLI